jgi:hypothetical protein
LTIIEAPTCGRGHAIAPEDITPDGRCRTCERERDRRRTNIKAGRHPREVLLRVPNAALRAHYLRLIAQRETTSGEIARNLGWFCNGRSGPKPDSARLRRALGLAVSVTRGEGGERVEYRVDELDYERAQAICLAMHADPPTMEV